MSEKCKDCLWVIVNEDDIPTCILRGEDVKEEDEACERFTEDPTY